MKFSYFFVMQKDYHECFFGFFVFFTWSLQCLRHLDDFYVYERSMCDEKTLFSGGKFRKKRVVGFFRKKSMLIFSLYFRDS